MLTLLMMRHAKSDWQIPGLPDHDRPLNTRGCYAAPLMGRYVEEANIPLEAILASTAKRVQETIELMQPSWQKLSPAVTTTRSLYLASASEISNQVVEFGAGVTNLMVVGHNPGLEDLASRLAETPIEFPTAGLAIFETAAANWDEAFRSAKWWLRDFQRVRDLQS